MGRGQREGMPCMCHRMLCCWMRAGMDPDETIERKRGRERKRENERGRERTRENDREEQIGNAATP